MTGVHFPQNRSTTSQTGTIARVLKPFPIMDAWIRLREGFLARMVGYNREENLNSATGAAFESDADPAAELKKKLDAIRVVALDEPGYHVDYKTLRSNPALAAYRQKASGLQAFDPAGLPSDAARAAFWINLYNALVMDAVIAFNVQHSVGEGRLGLLAFFRRAAYNVGGLRVSLDDIEHGFLRGNRGHPFLPGQHFASKNPRLAWVLPLDPRVHFALNCASHSCPPIQFYTAEKLDIQLELATRNFVTVDLKVDLDNHVLCLSSIFKWFEKDFGGRKGVMTFLLDHLPRDERYVWLSQHQATTHIKYEPYDWDLNAAELS